MCDLSNRIVLTETDDAQISWCKCCKNYSMIYGKCCFVFSEREIKRFEGVLLQLRDEDFHYSFLDNHYAIIKKDHASMGISLTKRDTKRLILLIREAVTVKEVFGIIYN